MSDSMFFVSFFVKFFVLAVLFSLGKVAILSLVTFILIKKDSAGKRKKQSSQMNKNMITHMFDEGWIDYDRYHEVMDMNAQAQQQFLQQQQEQFTQMQLQEMQNWQEQAMQQTMRDMDNAMRMSTGIEFGGYNPDPNLNPGMDFAQSMAFDPGPAFDTTNMWTGF